MDGAKGGSSFIQKETEYGWLDHEDLLNLMFISFV